MSITMASTLWIFLAVGCLLQDILLAEVQVQRTVMMNHEMRTFNFLCKQFCGRNPGNYFRDYYDDDSDFWRMYEGEGEARIFCKLCNKFSSGQQNTEQHGSSTETSSKKPKENKGQEMKM